MEPARTEAELFEREERLALAGLSSDARALLDDLGRATGLPQATRKHPLATIAIASIAGALLGPRAVRIALRAARMLAPRLLVRGGLRATFGPARFDPLAWIRSAAGTDEIE